MSRRCWRTRGGCGGCRGGWLVRAARRTTWSRTPGWRRCALLPTRGGRCGRGWRRWWNLVRMGRRRDARRPAGGNVEDEAAGGHGPDDLLASLQLQRRLATLVWELEEPYRSTILMRFYEDMASPEIAAKVGVPAGTVRWRLSEGVRRLRAGLD